MSSARHNSEVRVQTQDFDVQAIYDELRMQHAAEVGAVALFVGLVRDRNAKAGDGSEVSTLTLEHYPGMTEQSIAGILARARKQWPLLGIRVVHRVGELAPQEQIVLVAVTSAHRDAAFAGAEYIMDYLKTDAVLWKREATAAGDTAAGDQWIQSTQDDLDRAEHWGNKKSNK